LLGFIILVFICGNHSNKEGQPNVGDQHYVNSLQNLLPNKVFRIINHSDIVPRIPNDSLILGTKSKNGKCLKKLGYVEGPGTVQYFDRNQVLSPNLSKIPSESILGKIEAALPSWLTHISHVFTKQSEVSHIIRATMPNFLMDHFPAEYIAVMRNLIKSIVQ
jgi:hypothetical protein